MEAGTCILVACIIILTSVAKIEAACDISNCQTCDDGDTSCTICSEGYFLFEDGDCRACEHTCKANASSTLPTCRQGDGYCQFGCSDGFYGDRCTSPCSSTCKAILCDRSNGRCTHGCKLQSFMGDSCLVYCPTGCSNGTCTQDGDCLNQCKPNYYNAPRCDKNCDYCSQNSSDPQARKCDLDTGACIHGCSDSTKWGPYCDSICSIGCEGQLCDFSTGQCNGNCQNTTVWGNTCKNMCNPDCYNAECNKDNGTCITGCTGNTTWGPYCNKTCPSGCEGNLCNANTGHCTGNCQNTTVWGETCDNVCSSDCLNDKCYQKNGNCLVGCTDNTTWGSNCNKTCPSGCKINMCNFRTGYCTGSCQSKTVWGETCEQNCSSACLNDTCSKVEGSCLEGCSDETMWGPNCSNFCPDTCNQSRCDQLSGNCLDGCISSSLWGNNCYLNCSANCKDNSCSKTDGTCMKGCVDQTYWGSNCSFTCPSSCTDNKCDRKDGLCSVGCVSGLAWGFNCETSCTSCAGGSCNARNGVCLNGCSGNTTWGLKCEFTCPENCKSDVCDRSDGTCIAGCVNNTLWGKTCNSTCSHCSEGCSQNSGACLGEFGEETSSNLIVYILVSCGIVFFVAALVAVVIKTKNRKAKHTKDDEEEITVEFRDGTNNIPMRAVNALTTLFVQNPITRMLQRGLTQTFQRRHTTFLGTNRFEVRQLLSIVLNMEKSELEAEFEGLGTEYTRSYEVATKSENISRNTYPDIYPYDYNRVTLPQETKTDTSYINASYIKGFDGEQRYIAAQGPSRQTKEDFWKMVWMEDVNCIVMMSGTAESEFKLIDRYLPDPDSVETFGNISVYGGASENYADFVTNSYTIKRGDAEKHVTHLQFTAWEGGSPPSSACSLIEFHQKYRSMIKGHTNPRTVVHCTAGVGRTGVFIALDILTDEGLSEDHVDILACVANLRDQRVQMVQTQDQYEFLYKAVAQTLCLQCQLIPVKEFGHHDIDLEDQLQKCNDSLDLDTDEIPTLTFEQEKISGTKGSSQESSGSLYTNISNARHLGVTVSDTYRHKDGVIMTQSPGADLATDFCSLVMKKKCSVILKLNDVEKNKQSFLPKQGCSKKYGSYQVTTVSVKDLPTHGEIQVKFEFKQKKCKESLDVKMLQYKGWTDANVLPSPGDLFRIDTVVRENMDRYPGRPLLVQCSDGVTQSGLFSAIHDLSEKLLTETDISVVNSVRKLKGKARNAIPSLEQFKLCYDLVDSM